MFDLMIFSSEREFEVVFRTTLLRVVAGLLSVLERLNFQPFSSEMTTVRRFSAWTSITGVDCLARLRCFRKFVGGIRQT